MTELESIVADQTQEEMAALRRRIFELSKDRTYEQMVQGDKIKALNQELANVKLQLSKSENSATLYKDWLIETLRCYLEDSRNHKFTGPNVVTAESRANGFSNVESRGWDGK
jgi:hypothetical protein